MNSNIRLVQKHCLEILKQLVEICNTHNIQYYLVGGSALGAYRHEGFIPWDDDIDIAIPRKQYAHFLQLCLEKLDERFYVQDYSVDGRYIFPFAKIRLDNTAYVDQDLHQINMHHGIYIDVFPLDNIPDNKSIQHIQKYGLKFCNAVRMAKWDIQSITKMKNVILTIMKYCIPLSVLPFLYKFFMEIASSKQTKKIGNVVGAYSYEKESIDKEIFGKGKKMYFEQLECTVPEKIEQFLTEIFGENYMELPPVDERKTHNPMFISFTENYKGSKYKL